MGKWHDYANRQGTWLGELFNENMRQVLRVGIHALVENTKMDSGRAAAHWIIVPNKGGNPGARAQTKFPNPDFGSGPVGNPGDALTESGNEAKIIKAVVEREWSRAIAKSIRGRRPATRFSFFSSVPEYWDDNEKAAATGGWNYRHRAQLEKAQQAAKARMQIKFNALMAANNVRKNPLR